MLNEDTWWLMVENVCLSLFNDCANLNVNVVFKCLIFFYAAQSPLSCMYFRIQSTSKLYRKIMDLTVGIPLLFIEIKLTANYFDNCFRLVLCLGPSAGQKQLEGVGLSSGKVLLRMIGRFIGQTNRLIMK